MPRVVRIGSRRSRLARWQSEYVAARLRERWPDLQVEIVFFTTRGDREAYRPLPEIGGKGLFTAELEAALRRGEIDLAVHSLKDLPTSLAPDLTIAAILPREDPHDVLISRHGLPLEALPAEPVVGTSSTRRAAQVRLVRPDARILPLRGNVDTRIRKALDPEGPYDAIILARAGVVRLGLEESVTQVLPFDVMLPAPGQGALAVQCRAGDTTILSLVEPLHDATTAAAVTAERAFLQAMGGGCAQPIAALGRVEDARLILEALYVTPEGRPIRVQGEARPEEAEALGRKLADEVQRLAQRDPHREQPSLGAWGRPRVLILRATEQAADLAAAVRGVGMQPVIYPVIRIMPPESWEPLDAALRRLATAAYDWLVLTSANGVRFVWERLRELGLSVPRSVRIAAIGPATAAALRAHGRKADFVPTSYVAEVLAEEIPEVEGQRVLLARADRARPALREALARRGAIVEEVTAYRTVVAPPASPPPEVDVVVFTSPSTVEGLKAALDRFGQLLPARARVVCIGPITADAARAAGFPVHVVAEEHTGSGVIRALEALFKEG